MKPWLTQEEIDDLCRPLKQPAAQCRFIERTFGFKPKRKADDSPLVMRAQIEPPKSDTVEPPQNGRTGPNRAALNERWKNKAK